MSGGLRGKVAIVTGSSSGIGAAIARRFSAEGAAVVVNSASSVTAGESLAAELGEGLYVRADVREEPECTALVTAALQRWGRLDIVVNNAGWTQVVAHDDLDGATDESWERILGPNVLGPEIRVNALAPGLIDTPWTEDWDAVREVISARAPLHRSGTPEDMADACLALVQSRYVTGEVFVADGGMHLRMAVTRLRSAAAERPSQQRAVACRTGEHRAGMGMPRA